MAAEAWAEDASAAGCLARATIVELDSDHGCPLRLPQPPQPARPVALACGLPRPILPAVPAESADRSFPPRRDGRSGLRFGLLQRIDRPPRLMLVRSAPLRDRERHEEIASASLI